MASPEDADFIVPVFGPHLFHESGLGAYTELDIPHSVGIVKKQMERGDLPTVLAYAGDAPVGVASYSLDTLFTKKPIAYLQFIYVVPQYRRSNLGRMLLTHVMHLAQGDAACAFFATIPPATRTGRSLCNMFVRGGFKPMGGSFMRRI